MRRQSQALCSHLLTCCAHIPGRACPALCVSVFQVELPRVGGGTGGDEGDEGEDGMDVDEEPSGPSSSSGKKGRAGDCGLPLAADGLTASLSCVSL